MFDEFQKSRGYKPRWIGVRILAGGAGGLLLSLGLCGVGSVVKSENSLGAISLIGLYLFLASCLTVLVAVVVAIVELIVVAVRKGLAGKDEER